MLTATITLVALCVGSTVALAGFSCESTKDLGCTGSNSGGGCCKECIAQVKDDNTKIANWLSDFKTKNPTMSAAQIDKYEAPDRLDWGHPNLKNCYYCAGQCWDNPDDNLHCQVSQADPFGDKGKKRTVSVFEALESPTLYPEVAAAHKAGMEELNDERKRNVEAACGAAERDSLTLFIPGFGKRYHCDSKCLAQFDTKAPSPAPTPHPGQVGMVYDVPMETFPDAGGQQSTAPGGYTAPTAPINNTPKPGIAIIPVPPGQQMTGALPACTKEGEVCGMAGSTKLFCKCKVCGFKGDTCAGNVSSISFLATAIAFVAAVLRFW